MMKMQHFKDSKLGILTAKPFLKDYLLFLYKHPGMESITLSTFCLNIIKEQNINPEDQL